MTERIKQQNHMTSLRLPLEWDHWIKSFASRWHVPPSIIYRSAIREFIQKQSAVQQ